MSDFKGGFAAGLLTSSVFNIILILFFALVLSGCATTFESTYWRHPDTGRTVECEASWINLDQAVSRRAECERLMREAGLRPIDHREGKAWEATTR